MPNHFFHFKRFSILSQEKGLKVNTDSCLLGALASHPEPARILDIGTGTGVIALMLAQRYANSEITAIELFEDVCSQALYNISSSEFKAQIKVIHGDFLNHPFETQFDLMVCNPPYFNNHLQKTNAGSKNDAIHNRTLPFDEMIKTIRAKLHKEGTIVLIAPERECTELMHLAELNGLFVIRKTDIINQNKLFRQVISFSPSFSEPISNQLVIRENGQDTPVFRELMKDFYLDNPEIYRTPKH